MQTVPFQYPVGTYPAPISTSVIPVSTIPSYAFNAPYTYPAATSTVAAPVTTTFSAPIAYPAAYPTTFPGATYTMPTTTVAPAPTYTMPLQTYPTYTVPAGPVVPIQETPLVPVTTNNKPTLVKQVRPVQQRLHGKAPLLAGHTRAKSRVPRHLRDDIPRPRAPSPHVVVPRWYPLNPLPKLL